MLGTKLIKAAAGAGGAESDDDFANTVLLLHGDGTNGAQNNTFLDSSTNNFTITRNGNTTQGSFTPFSKPDGRWGNLFNQGTTGQYLSTPNAAGLTLGSSDFCIEWWENRTALGAEDTPIIVGDGGAYAGLLAYYDGGFPRFYLSTTGSSYNVFSNAATSAISANEWNHFCVTRSGTAFRVFLNGQLDLYTTASGSVTQPNNKFFIVGGHAAQTSMPGYMSNVRICIGSIPTSYETSSTTTGTQIFTPSTTALTTSSEGASNVKLLTCQSNRFVDNSTSPYTLTVNGEPKVTPFSPFPITTEYSPAVNGGSGYFDGSGDFLDTPTNQISLDVTQGDFTIEAWVYRNASGAQHYICSQRVVESGYELRINSDNTLQGFYTAGSSITSTGTVPSNQWVHICWVRSSSTASLYINGTRDGTGSFSNGSSAYTTRALRIGYTSDPPAGYMNGYVSSFRLVKGTAVYDPTQTTITPPTAPLTAITDTQFLCNFTNAGIFDNTGFNNLETVGDAQIDTSVKKYGTGAMKFDGTGDSLFARNIPEFSFGTGNFTVEAWIYSTARGVYPMIVKSAADGTWANGWSLCFGYQTTEDKLQFWINGSNILQSANAVSLNVWHHVAVSRSGTSLKMFVDGTEEASATNSTSLNTTSPLTIGSDINSSNYTYTGYIDDLRITKGIARYTAAFTPPTKAFPNVGE